MRLLFVCIIMHVSWLVKSQDIRVDIHVISETIASLTVDGEDMGLANGQRIRFGFNERKGISEHVIEISAPGYETQEYKFESNAKRVEKIECRLERILPKIEGKGNLILNVEKVVSGLEYGSDVGLNTLWKFQYNEEIDLPNKKHGFDKAIKAVGLSTLGDTGDDLFDTGKSMPKNPDILIGGRVEHFEVERDGKYYVSEIQVNWQLYDRYEKRIILKKDVVSKYYFETLLVSDGFKNAIVDNFHKLLSDKNEFGKTLQAVNTDVVRANSSSDTIDDSGIENQVLIKRVRVEPVKQFSDMIKYAQEASVTILIDQDEGHGSGVVISSDGYIVTNHHVVDGAKLVDAEFNNGIVLGADVITASEKYDLALLKVHATGLKALPIVFESAKAREGNEVVIIGAPGAAELGQSVSKGIISGKRKIDGVSYIQTDAKISLGNSGSPMINEQGEVIGIVNMKMVGAGIEGLNFAIDAAYLQSILGISYD